MITSCEGGHIAILRAVVGNVPVTQLVRCQHIHDGEEVIAVIIPKEDAPLDIAERIAELLQVHWLASVPDDAAGVAS